MTDVGRSKNNDYPSYMTDDGDRGGFVVRNPITGKKRRFAANEEQKARETATLLTEWIEKEREAQALDAGRPTIAGLCDAWERDRLQFQPWDDGTRVNFMSKVRRIRRELGKRIVTRTDCTFMETWISSFTKTADTFNDWRYVFLMLWRYAVARKLADANEGEKIEYRSTSKKLEANRKVRMPLCVDGFKATYAKAPPWLQIAMEQSLVTLQAREEICNMQLAHYRNGFLFVIRDKTAGDSDMAFIKIVITPELEEIRERSLAMQVLREGNVSTIRRSPYLVHRAPERRRKDWIEGKPHWTYVEPDYLTKAFKKARDASGYYAHLDERQRPTFHEIRGLGSRLLEERGVSKKAIQALMTHANKRVTEIYLDGGVQALSDDDYQTVTAPLRPREILG